MPAATELTTASTVGQIVADRPQAARVFERLGIDYCCGGRQTLAAACEEKTLNAAEILAALLNEPEPTTTESSTDWQQASLTELIDDIEETHHVYLHGELPRLEAMVRKVAAVHGDRHPWMMEIDSVFAGFSASMQSHLLKEEQMLFPLIRDLESQQNQPAGGIEKPLEVHEHEHDDAGRSLARMRRLSHDYQAPDDACATFRAMLEGLAKLEADTHMHIHKENSILFPRATALAKQRTAS